MMIVKSLFKISIALTNGGGAASMHELTSDKVCKRMRKMIKRQGLKNILFCAPDLNEHPSYSPFGEDRCGNFFIYIPKKKKKNLNEIEINRTLSDLLEDAIGYFELAS